jgi:hypothetical protein
MRDFSKDWVPAFAGTTGGIKKRLNVIPAEAGIHARLFQRLGPRLRGDD